MGAPPGTGGGCDVPWERLELISTEELMLRWHEHADRSARDTLIERFRPLARRLARRYVTPIEPFEDLEQWPRWDWWRR